MTVVEKALGLRTEGLTLFSGEVIFLLSEQRD